MLNDTDKIDRELCERLRTDADFQRAFCAKYATALETSGARHVDAITLVEQRGADRVLVEIAKLPTPWDEGWSRDRNSYADDLPTLIHRCMWCDVEGPFNSEHPYNGCLWPRACAARASAKET